MQYNRLIILLFFFLFSLFSGAESLKAGNKFRLEVNAPSQKNKVAYLLGYWEGSTYIQDSTYISPQGNGIFQSEEKIEAGQYLLYIKPDIQIDLLIDKEQENIKINVDDKDVMESKISGCRDTELFWRYLVTLDNNMQRQFALSDKLEEKGISDNRRIDIERQKEELNREFQTYIDNQLKAYGDTWYGIFLKGTASPEPPVKNPLKEEDYRQNRKNHYFDNINLSDSRFWRTNYFISYLDTYMSAIVEQNVDSLAAAASYLVGKSASDKYCFEKMLSRYTNESLTSNVMGMENVWMCLYEEYIRGKDINWIDSSQMAELEKLYVQNEYNRIGMKAHDLQLQSLSGNKINIYGIESDYLLLYFYNPACVYCEQEIPKIHQMIASKYNETDMKIVSIDIGADMVAWRSFVERLELNDWINCADPGYKSDYWIYYDTSTTPATFLLDRNKKIIGRKFDKEGLEKILNYYIQK